MHSAAVPSARRGKCIGQGKPGVAVRHYLSTGISVTLVDERPDEDGFGHPDSDAVLLREAARWLDAHPTLELTAIFAGYSATGHRELTMSAIGEAGDEPGRSGPTGRLIALPETP